MLIQKIMEVPQGCRCLWALCNSLKFCLELTDEGRAVARPFLFGDRGDVVDQPDVGQAHGEGDDDRAGDVGHFFEGVRMGDRNVIDARVKLALDVRPQLGYNPADVALALFDPVSS